MELNHRENFCVIIFYNFRRGLTQQQWIDELNSIYGDQAPSNVYRLVAEYEIVVHSKMNYVKVVQNQLLFRKDRHVM